MKKNNLLVLLAVVVSALFVFTAAPMVDAATCGKDSSGKDIQTSFDYGCKSDTTGSITSIVLYVINFLAVGVGIAVVGGIAWGGFMYSSANGDAGKAKEGRTIVVNAVIGLVLFFILWAAINFLVPGGLFG